MAFSPDDLTKMQEFRLLRQRLGAKMHERFHSMMDQAGR